MSPATAIATPPRTAACNSGRGRRTSYSSTPPALADDMIDPALAADMMLPKLAADPIEKADTAEPSEPIDRTLPTEPILSIESVLAIDSTELREAMDHLDDIPEG